MWNFNQYVVRSFTRYSLRAEDINMPAQCRKCGHKVEILQKKCNLCGSTYPSFNQDFVIVFLIVFLTLIILGVYLFFNIAR